MKRLKLLTAVVVVMLQYGATSASAKSWRINNDTNKGAHFTSINAAMSSEDVTTGDTLYLDPGCSMTEDQTITKQVYLIGCGYSNNHPYTSPVISGMLYINASYTKVIGTELRGTVCIGADYVTIERCKASGRITVTGNSCLYATIRQCYISTNTPDKAIRGYGKADTRSDSWTIENNIVIANGSYNVSCIAYLYNANIRNNLLICRPSYQSWTLEDISYCNFNNNIIFNTGNAASGVTNGVNNCIMSHNVISQDIDSENNHSNVTNISTVLTGDYEHYTLVDESPAANYGVDGKDCGIFGGLFPYVEGGLPFGHPHFSKAVIGSSIMDGNVNVSLQIKLQDE